MFYLLSDQLLIVGGEYDVEETELLDTETFQSKAIDRVKVEKAVGLTTELGSMFCGGTMASQSG